MYKEKNFGFLPLQFCFNKRSNPSSSYHIKLLFKCCHILSRNLYRLAIERWEQVTLLRFVLDKVYECNVCYYRLAQGDKIFLA